MVAEYFNNLAMVFLTVGLKLSKELQGLQKKKKIKDVNLIMQFKMLAIGLQRNLGLLNELSLLFIKQLLALLRCKLCFYQEHLIFSP